MILFDYECYEGKIIEKKIERQQKKSYKQMKF